MSTRTSRANPFAFGANSLLLAVLLRGAAAADTYTKIPLSDCNSHDVTPQPSCGGNRNLSVAVLEACCDSTRGCFGFNTHDIIKDATCALHVHAQPTVDLYLKPTPPPPPQGMPWPLPNDAQLSTGATTLRLSHDFAISAAAGSVCPTLDAAVRRYQNQRSECTWPARRQTARPWCC